MSSELRPSAQVYVPLEAVTPKGAQSSRYSRKTVRPMAGDSPRPILGTKAPFPRAILGRKEYAAGGSEEVIRSLTRNMQQKLRAV
ncbi:uncharacterized protein LOC123007792 [Tribolium madens]|uniref:uncharacterized protein LOC123007792 n=1 Tax=Tribolium madens TaxID=41895 RepID=UPI001CF754DA|nr:uncharacterized protein LOC123007792 [Tribolium madens]